MEDIKDAIRRDEFADFYSDFRQKYSWEKKKQS